MYFSDEKDYIMRMIKEMVKILFSLICGKKYVSVEFEKENKYEVSGKNLKSFLDMIDSGQINEAENILLDNIDYTNNDDVMAAALFYQYLSEKDSEFLINNNYTKEEVLSGFKQRKPRKVKNEPTGSVRLAVRWNRFLAVRLKRKIYQS